MSGQEPHDLTEHLQRRHVPVDVDPVSTLDVKPHLLGKQIVDRTRVLRHRAPPTSTEGTPAQRSNDWDITAHATARPDGPSSVSLHSGRRAVFQQHPASRCAK